MDKPYSNQRNINFLQNPKHEQYVQVDDDDAPSYWNDGGIAELQPFDGGNYQKWVFTHVGNGYYIISSNVSGYAITVPDDKKLKADVDLILTNYANKDTQKWRFITTSHGYCKIKAKSSESTTDKDLVLAVETSYTFDKGWDLQQRTYEDNTSYRDEWILANIGYASSVALEGQQKSKWCWATSARMFSKHFYPTVSHTQSEAVTHVKGSAVNEGGTRTEAQQAINYYISSVSSSATINTVVKDYNIYSENRLADFLDDGYVVYIARRWYDDIDDPLSHNGGHASLIFGYVLIDSDIRFLVRDPWPVNKGETYTMSYEKLCNGRDSQNDETPDTGVWYASIVVNTTYVNDTIPYYFDK